MDDLQEIFMPSSGLLHARGSIIEMAELLREAGDPDLGAQFARQTGYFIALARQLTSQAC